MNSCLFTLRTGHRKDGCGGYRLDDLAPHFEFWSDLALAILTPEFIRVLLFLHMNRRRFTFGALIVCGDPIIPVAILTMLDTGAVRWGC